MSAIAGAVRCPGCAAPMTPHRLDAQMGGSVTMDVCLACQSFWFDGYESLQLTPGSTLRLFRIIGDESSSTRTPMPPVTACPRCTMRLVPATDRQRNTRFRYGRCPRGHGRFITFFDFLREKDFVRTLSAQQVAELRAQVQTVNCSNCGAPIDLAATSSCGHCGSPLSMLDMRQADALITQLRAAATAPAAVSPTLPLDLLMVRREAERAFATDERGPAWYRDAVDAGTVAAGVRALARWLGRDVS